MTPKDKIKINLIMLHIEEGQKKLSEAWNSLLFTLNESEDDVVSKEGE